jgi:hypothetical protein
VQPSPEDPAPQNPDQEIHQPQATRGQDGAFLHAPQGSVTNPSPPSPFPGQTSEQQAASQQPPSPTQSAPSPMPPPSRSGNNPRDKPVQPPRDGSMAGHHAQGTERLSGLQSFPANVIPAGSQGQPFRGPGGQQGEADAARGPTERSLADMTEDDFEKYQQLQKDNKELSRSCLWSGMHG